MDKAQAIHSFWSSFGLPAYDQDSVPSDAQLPYITYDVSTGAIGDFVSLSGHLWYLSTSWEAISKKADEIARAVGEHGHKIMKVDGGYVMVAQGAPFAQRMSDQSDERMKRMYINVSAEFYTAY